MTSLRGLLEEVPTVPPLRDARLTDGVVSGVRRDRPPPAVLREVALVRLKDVFDHPVLRNHVERTVWRDGVDKDPETTVHLRVGLSHSVGRLRLPAARALRGYPHLTSQPVTSQ